MSENERELLISKQHLSENHQQVTEFCRYVCALLNIEHSAEDNNLALLQQQINVDLNERKENAHKVNEQLSELRKTAEDLIECKKSASSEREELELKVTSANHIIEQLNVENLLTDEKVVSLTEQLEAEQRAATTMSEEMCIQIDDLRNKGLEAERVISDLNRTLAAKDELCHGLNEQIVAFTDSQSVEQTKSELLILQNKQLEQKCQQLQDKVCNGEQIQWVTVLIVGINHCYYVYNGRA